MINAVIVYLSRKLDMSDLKKSLKLLHKNFTKRYNYPVLIFHDDFTNEDQNTLLEIYSNIEFEKTNFEIPSWIDKSQINKGSHKIRIGYMHMCRFFSGEIFNHDAIKNYDWYWRLDSDSYLHSPIKYDIFNFMERKGFIYGYLETNIKDSPKFVIGLWDLTKEYIQKNNIQPKFLNKYLDKDGEWDRSLFYTNFEISKLDFWRSKGYMEYYKMIDQNGGIYYYRWGDHTIHLLALSMLADEHKLHCFKDIDYSHQSFRPNRRFPSLKQVIGSSYIQPLKNIKIIFNLLKNIKKIIKNTINLRKWIKSGKSLPGPHFYKQKVVKYYARKFSLEIFIETGTYQGDMIHAVKKKFKHIYSIELNEALYRNARKRFVKNNHISIIYGDSTVQLKKILSKINKPCLFWLDAHYSGGITAKGDLETPIMEEMNLILNHSNLKHIILIDDARLFIGKNDYPSIEKIKNLVFKNHKGWLFIIKDDIIRIHSKP